MLANRSSENDKVSSALNQPPIVENVVKNAPDNEEDLEALNDSLRSINRWSEDKHLFSTRLTSVKEVRK